MEEGLVHRNVKLQAGSSLALVSLVPQMVVEQQEVRGPAGLKVDSPQADNSLSAQSESCKGSSRSSFSPGLSGLLLGCLAA